MDPIWLVRMSRWVRNPPSRRTVYIVLTVIALCLILVGIETFIGWPDALTAERVRGVTRPQITAP